MAYLQLPSTESESNGGKNPALRPAAALPGLLQQLPSQLLLLQGRETRCPQTTVLPSLPP